MLSYECLINVCFAFCILHRYHDDVIKWKHFPRNWPFVREIHRSPVNFPHKGQWRGALMFSLIYVWINDWVNNREAGDLRRQHGHYDVIVMMLYMISCINGLWFNEPSVYKLYLNKMHHVRYFLSCPIIANTIFKFSRDLLMKLWSTCTLLIVFNRHTEIYLRTLILGAPDSTNWNLSHLVLQLS